MWNIAGRVVPTRIVLGESSPHALGGVEPCVGCGEPRRPARVEARLRRRARPIGWEQVDRDLGIVERKAPPLVHDVDHRGERLPVAVHHPAAERVRKGSIAPGQLVEIPGPLDDLVVGYQRSGLGHEHDRRTGEFQVSEHLVRCALPVDVRRDGDARTEEAEPGEPQSGPELMTFGSFLLRNRRDHHELEAAGVSVARNLYGEAGQGLADDACDVLAQLEATLPDE